MEVAVTTDVGTVGRHNEDSWCAEQLHRNVTLLAVADGFGRIHGLSSACLTIETIREAVRRELRGAIPPRSITGGEVRELLIRAFSSANDKLLEASGGDDDHVSAGSTCTAVLIVSNQAFIAHIGDSRAYLFRRGELVQLTTDESIIPELVTSTGGQRRQARYKHVRPLLTRALGVEARTIAPKVTHYPLHGHDAILFCTDGAYRPLSSSDFEGALSSREHRAEWVTDRILTLARAAGSVDNATVLLARDATEHGAPNERVNEPKPRSRSLLATMSVAAIMLAAGIFLMWTADTKLYVGADPSGRVTLYSGVPATLLGVPMHLARKTYGLSDRSLPQTVRTQLDDGITVSSPAAAASLVSQWQAQARH